MQRSWKSAALLVLTFCVGACEMLERPQASRFEPVSGGFRFRAIADGAYPESSPGGEAQRLSWLTQNLQVSGTCPAGYTITSREPVFRSKGILGDNYDVYYEGRCTGAALN